jgi:hypothetical protein
VTPNALHHHFDNRELPLNFTSLVQQFSRRNDFGLVVSSIARLSRTSIPYNLAELIRCNLLELLDCLDVWNRDIVIILGVAALVGR